MRAAPRGGPRAAAAAAAAARAGGPHVARSLMHPTVGAGGLCPWLDLRLVVLLGVLLLTTRTFRLAGDVDIAEGGKGLEFDLEAEREKMLLERAERQKRRDELAEKKLKEEEALAAASRKRAKDRAQRRKEQGEEQQRLNKDLAREAKARHEEEGIDINEEAGGAAEDDVDPAAADLGGAETQDAVRKRHAREPRPEGPGAGGRFVSPNGWSDAAPRRCDTWADGPFQGKGKAQIQKAVWIQTHGNNTASQWKRLKDGVTNGKWKIHGGNRYHHMAALVRLPSGALLSAWQAAEDTEGEQDQHLRISISTSPKSWRTSWQVNVSRTGGAMWSPVPHVDSTGRLFLFYAESEGDCLRQSKPKNKWPTGGSLKMTYCLDEEPTPTSEWAEPRTIYGIEEDGWIPKMLSNNLIVTTDGLWVLPFWRENAMLAKASWPDAQEHCRTKDNPQGQKHSNTAVPYASVLVSKDGGSTWESRGKLHDAAYPNEDGWTLATKTTWLVENSVVELKNGSFLMLFRTSTGYIYQATSADKGFTWTEPEPSSVVNPGSKSQVIRLNPDGPLLLAFNDHKQGFIKDAEGATVKLPPKCVTVLSLALSEDEGTSWRRIGVLRGGAAPGLRFSYPWVLQMGCKVLVSYSKFYVTGFKHTENDRELGLRAVHVHL